VLRYHGVIVCKRGGGYSHYDDVVRNDGAWTLVVATKNEVRVSPLFGCDFSTLHLGIADGVLETKRSHCPTIFSRYGRECRGRRVLVAAAARQEETPWLNRGLDDEVSNDEVITGSVVLVSWGGHHHAFIHVT